MFKLRESHFSEQNARMPYGASGLDAGLSVASISLKTPKPVRPKPIAIGKTSMSSFKKEDEEGILAPKQINLIFQRINSLCKVLSLRRVCICGVLVVCERVDWGPARASLFILFIKLAEIFHQNLNFALSTPASFLSFAVILKRVSSSLMSSLVCLTPLRAKTLC